MEGKYETSKGIYRETVSQVRDITVMQSPGISSRQEHNRAFSTKYNTMDLVKVYGTNGSLDIGISIGEFGLWQRIKHAYNLIRGKNVDVLSTCPTKEDIDNHPIVRQYLTEAKAFNKALQEKRAQKREEVLSERQFEVTAQGIKELSLEDKLPK